MCERKHTRRSHRVEEDQFDELKCPDQSTQFACTPKDSLNESMTSVPSDAIGSMSFHDGTTSLILVVHFNRAFSPWVSLSFSMISPVAMAVKSFEFEPIAKSVCTRSD